MRNSPDHGELTEILIKGHEGSTLGKRDVEKFFVSWVFIPTARPDDVMTARLQHIGMPPQMQVSSKSLMWCCPP